MFDAFTSAVVLLLLSPLFIVVSVLIKLTSAGPVLFFQERVGRQERLFRIAKFRSMRNHSEIRGLAITVRGDVRVTPLGRVLRFCKIDELPQLWNVLKGEMSLVGPRPELARYVRGYTARQRTVLTVQPGMTDPASVEYAREEHLLSLQADPEKFYQDVILPHKLNLNLEYIDKASFSGDMSLLAKTIFALCFSHLDSVTTT